MEFKPHEIALMIAAVAIPLVFLVLGFTPGGLSFIGDWRIYRRLRPAQKKKSAPTPHVTPTPKFSLKRDPPNGDPKS